MSALWIVPHAEVEELVLAAVERTLRGELLLQTKRAPATEPPPAAYDRERGQYSSTEILRAATANALPRTGRVLVITNHDLFIPMLSFVYGQAQLGGSVAVISLARLRQSFYGLPDDGELLMERARKEALHELGHTFGLRHCPQQSCAMSLSTDIQQVDGKEAAFCPSCKKLVREADSTVAKPPGDLEARR